MKSRVLLIAAAVVAGWAVGWVSGSLPTHDAGSMLPHAAPAGSLTGAGSAHSGTSDAREIALGTALMELSTRRSGLAGLARLGAALDLLDSTQMARLLEQLERGDARQFDDRLGWLFARWIKRDPAAAQAWVRPRLDLAAQDGPSGFMYEMNPRAPIVLAWARADPQAALDYAKQHARSGLATALLRQVLSVWSERDVHERLALVLAFPAGTTRDQVLHDLHRDWAAYDPAAAFASAQALEPGPERDKTVGDTLIAWAVRDGAAAFGQYRAFGLKDPVLLARVLEKSAEKNPLQTLEWLQQLDGAQSARCAPRIVNAWAAKDPVAALNWALANGMSLVGHYEPNATVVHSGLGRATSYRTESFSPLSTALKTKPEATLAWARGLPPGEDRDRVIGTMIGAGSDRQQAISLFETLPPEAAARSAGRIARMFQDNVEGGRAWALSLPAGTARAQALAGLGALTDKTFDLPPGPDRDAVICGGLNHIGEVPPPAERLAPLLEISDPTLRRDMVDELMETYVQMSYWTKDARAALEKANIPEEWKQRWRVGASGGK